MALRYELRSFADIIAAVMETAKIQSTDTVEKNRVKRNINTIYLDEVVPFKTWSWLRSSINLSIPAVYTTGTASVTEDSVAVTLSTGPTISYKDYKFSVDGSNDVYIIDQHTAAGTAVTLQVPYAGETSATATFKIWTDAVVLPSNCEETIELSHAYHNRPVDNVGLQEFRRIVAIQPKYEARPQAYTTSDFKDPNAFELITGLPASATRATSGLVKTIKFNATLGATETALLLKKGDQIEVTVAGHYTYNIRGTVSSVTTTTNTNDTITYTALIPYEEASTADTGIIVKKLGIEGYERYREMLVYPAISTERTTLHLDYIKQVVPLEADTDEPAMSVEDRIVLYYGALWLTWSRQRNPEEANINKSLFDSKIMRMAGKTEDSPDKPLLVPSRRYLSAKRNKSYSRRNWKMD